MDDSRKMDALLCHDEVLSELYNASKLIKVTKISCQEREFSKNYYGISKECIPMLSDERNEYLSLLTVISDKISYAYNLSLTLENKITDL